MFGFRIYLSSIVLLVGLSQCGYIDVSQEIIDTWQIVDIEIEKLSEDSTEFISSDLSSNNSRDHFRQYNILYVFQEDHTYQILHGNTNDEGTWVLSQDQKVLILKSSLHPEDNAELLIQEFSPYQMLLVSEQNGVKEILTLESID